MNNKGADQTARMRRLVCAFVVHKPPKTGFLASRPKKKVKCLFKLTKCRGDLFSNCSIFQKVKALHQKNAITLKKDACDNKEFGVIHEKLITLMPI